MAEDREAPGPWRQARAIALLPGTVCLLLPALALLEWGTNVGWGLGGLAAGLPVILGLVLIGAGFSLWLWTVRLFARVGRGTLAPWDPTERLVSAGPYRRLRNPMITGVVAVLLGEAALFGSPPLLAWAAIFFVFNHLWFIAYEEPALERRYGEPYGAYRRQVPRWLPRRSG